MIGAGRRRFAALYGYPAAATARAPGRVNLVGEHIDYCGLAVLPMAIGRTLSLHYRPRPDAVVRIATDRPGLDARAFEIGPEIPPGPRGDWGNYAKAAARAVARGYLAGRRGPTADDGSSAEGRDPASAHTPPDARGIDGLVLSDLPEAAGLSSSSALVVACALALLDANGRSLGRDVDRRELARRLAAGERYVGTEGGGMDQAVCLLATADHALRIGFDPLRTAPVPIPETWRFVVADSLERAEKSGEARATYNRRRRESEEALRRLSSDARPAESPAHRPPGRETPGSGPSADRPPRAGPADAGPADAGPADAGPADAGPADAGPAGAAPPSYQRLLATQGPSALLARGDDLPSPLDRRFRHVVSEAVRVDAAERALREGNLAGFGEILLEGHASLRDACEVSTPTLDRLVELAVRHGASGARLTGAGLGGCVFAVCEAGSEGLLAAGLERDFYAGRALERPVETHLFSVRPSGAAVIETAETPGT